MTFPVNIHNKVNALYDTGAGCSLINYIDLDKDYQSIVKSSTRENMGALGQVTYTLKINGTPFTQYFIVCRHMTRHMILETNWSAQGNSWTKWISELIWGFTTEIPMYIFPLAV